MRFEPSKGKPAIVCLFSFVLQLLTQGSLIDDPRIWIMTRFVSDAFAPPSMAFQPITWGTRFQNLRVLVEDGSLVFAASPPYWRGTVQILPVTIRVEVSLTSWLAG